MEEQPQEQPQNEPAKGADGGPKIFSNLNTTIAGITGLLIALGGLAATWDKFFGEKPATHQTVVNTAAPAVDAPVQAAADVPAESEETLPTSYEGTFKGEPARIEYGDEQWVLADKDGTYTYDDELISPDDTRLLVFDSTNKSYLRWPIKGGMAEWSNDKDNWSNYARLYPSEPTEDENAAQ